MSGDIPKWAWKRAAELSGISIQGAKVSSPVGRAFASYIAEHEEEPVDPLLLEARECVAQAVRLHGPAEAIRRGDDDDCWPVRAALAAIKRGMELASKNGEG